MDDLFFLVFCNNRVHRKTYDGHVFDSYFIFPPSPNCIMSMEVLNNAVGN